MKKRLFLLIFTSTMYSFRNILFSICLGYSLTAAYNTWEDKIPNGDKVNLIGKSVCQICHEYSNPTSSTAALNSFGNDFNLAGNSWNQSLATKDSDGDLYTNERELQCPNNYSWISGPCGSNLDKVTNPGDKDSNPGIAVEQPVDKTRQQVSLSAMPNPFNPSTRIIAYGPFFSNTQPTLLLIFNARGSIVFSLKTWAGELREGIAWNGRDLQGRPVASGVYIAELLHPAGRAGCRLVLAR
ncbi:MAG: hypothetical protein A2268_10470 [Candidatus Raymondbacteria bacterium RifOxyA12_full_50_37]|nr:MAG: hypothetical protein A2268_10470 [Candidatus Raymondbacteria bacterium RifOxyA12_full_50_37]OGJ90180.1 MAG: hypothetical protein A2248_16950 [Candidatus Raymondbacteria bacterium RIFOXYA2_FULL_49_16]OGJ97252.1 MAG: hypothetical protein A2453_01440 [Candidatus Raymondbacteria bacterium RIFOXYC2_FULL_50_21]OGJ98831.1 MAG: hypothetical protein A2350_21540 [Candidatus Raymondbacteria bacterium RifOxyB12_full_50_8]OGP43082.1 MAG: hypothetical protein A2324_16705 [Candidatus Raymondbacteria b